MFSFFFSIRYPIIERDDVSTEFLLIHNRGPMTDLEASSKNERVNPSFPDFQLEPHSLDGWIESQ